MTQVKDLAGHHIGQKITIVTEHTETTGILQTIQIGAHLINEQDFDGDHWAIGQTTATITLVTGQTIVAKMRDNVAIHH